MNFQQFKSLPKDFQRAAVQHSGVFLFGRRDEDVLVKLYQINGFYVELFFNDNMSEVLSIVSFKDTAKLEPYLEQVDLSEIGSSSR